MIARFTNTKALHGTSAISRNKAKIYRYIDDHPEVTRKQIGKELGIRPATVSELVAELLGQGVLREGDPVAVNRKGRREVPLTIVADRFAAIVVHVVSNRIRGTLLDMSGSVRAERKPDLPVDTMAVNAQLEDLFVALIEDLRGHVPPGTELEGVGLALPGIVDELSGVWIFSSRWPHMREMNLNRITERTGLKVLVNKNLNAELEHQLSIDSEVGRDGILFVHWGYGIGATYAHDGQIWRPRGGRFGELGHWIGGTGTGRQCLCGNRGCLETEAALWSILPEIKRDYPDAPGDERAFEDFMRNNKGLSAHPSVRSATERFVNALHDLQMTLFARKMFITGPFVQDPTVFDDLRRGLMAKLPGYAGEGLELVPAKPFAMGEIIGAAAPFFRAASSKCLNP